jgi:hypothetical protein
MYGSCRDHVGIMQESCRYHEEIMHGSCIGHPGIIPEDHAEIRQIVINIKKAVGSRVRQKNLNYHGFASM